MQNAETNRDYYYVTSEMRSQMQELHREGYTIDDISELTGFSSACVHRHLNNVVSIYGDYYKTKYDPDRHTHGSREQKPVWNQSSNGPREAANDDSAKPTQTKAASKQPANSDRKTIQITGKAHSYIALIAELTGKTHMQIVEEMVQLHKEQASKLLADL